MKKFIVFSPQQFKLEKIDYEVMDNSKLKYGKTAFPIIPVINGYLKENEEFKILAIVGEHENTLRNFEELKEELNELFEMNKIPYDEQKNLKKISIPYEDGIDNQLLLFHKLLPEVGSDDEIYACITYGSKPSQIVELMLLRYVRQIKKNAYISCIVYGHKEWGEAKGKIYDVTALVHLDDVIRLAANITEAEGEALINSLTMLEE